MTPLLGVGACVSIQFGVVGAVKWYFAEKNGPEVKQLKTSQLYTAGMTAGIANSIVAGMCVLAFYHLIDASALFRTCGTYSYSTSSATRENLLGSFRLRSQVSTLKRSNSSNIFGRIVRQSGWTGVFRGMVPTMLREGHGMGVYFLTYEYLVQRKLQGRSREELSSTWAMLFGGSAGIAVCILR